MQWEGAQKCADIVKLAGYNYGERLYEEQHKQHPDWMIYGSETASVVHSRGVYHFPLAQSVLSDDDGQCSALGNSTPGWAAKIPKPALSPTVTLSSAQVSSSGQALTTSASLLPTTQRTAISVR